MTRDRDMPTPPVVVEISNDHQALGAHAIDVVIWAEHLGHPGGVTIRYLSTEGNANIYLSAEEAATLRVALGGVR